MATRVPHKAAAPFAVASYTNGDIPSRYTPLKQGGGGPPALAAAFKDKMGAANSDLVMSVLGDSTGNATDEWVYLLNKAIEAQIAGYYTDYYLYNDATKAYLLQALLGRASTFSLMTDTFDRADGALGTTGSGGQTWAANTWTIASGRAIPNAPSAVLAPAGSLASSSFKFEAKIAYATAGDYRFYFLNGSSKYIFVAVRGNNSIEVYYNIGAGNVAWFTVATPAMVAGTDYVLTIVKDGLNMWVDINGRQNVGTLSQAQDDALTGRAINVQAVTAVTGMSIDYMKVGGVTKPARKLTMRNGSISGTGFTYHTTNIATIIPEKPDIAFISLGHNETARPPASFMSAYDTYVGAVRSQAGDGALPIVAVIQNPEMSPAVGVAGQAANMEALRDGAASRGFDRVNVYGAFNSSPSGLAALIDNTDGVHPIPPGSMLWEATVAGRMGLNP